MVPPPVSKTALPRKITIEKLQGGGTNMKKSICVSWPALLFSLLIIFPILPTAYGQVPTPTPVASAFILYHNDPPDSLGLDAALIALIADHSDLGDSIDFCMYNLDRVEVANALISANDSGQGATVRVISDADSAYADEEYTTFKTVYQSLAEAGIPIQTNALNKTGAMHNKFVVFNGAKVWTGSYNATNSGTLSDSNDVVLIDSPELTAAYGIEFEEMWEGNYGIAKSDNTTHYFSVQGSSVKNYFSPTDGVKSKILQEIEAAESDITFLMFSFTDGGSGSISEAMVNKACGSPPVAVRGILDRQQGLSAYSQLNYFLKNQVPVKLDTFSGLLHHKLIIIDREGADPRIITGSYNLSENAEENNDENIVIIHGQELADSYYYLFEDIFTNHAEFPPSLAEDKLVISEVLADGAIRYFDANDPQNWARSQDDDGSSPGQDNVVDSIPPRIIHTPVTDVLQNRPVYIHCQVKDESYLYSAVEPTLYYRQVTDPPQDFTSVRMGALFDYYHAAIPTDFTSATGDYQIEYYLTAKDASHNLGSSPSVNPALHPYGINVVEQGPEDRILITEIMYDPPSTPESGYEWVEIYNSWTEETVSLAGWTFTDFDGTYEFPQGAEIGPGEYQVLCNDLASFQTAHPNAPPDLVTYEYGSSSQGDITLPNSWGIVTGMLALLNPEDLIVHEVNYSSGWGGQNGAGPNLNTLVKLDPLGLDDETQWMSSMVRGGTPGLPTDPHFIFTKYETGAGQVVTHPDLWLDKTLINPENPVPESVSVYYRLDRDCQVNVKIYNPPVDVDPEDCYDSQYLVRNLVSGQSRAENMDLADPVHEETWDGRDDIGVAVYGVCRVMIEAADQGSPELVCRTESDDTVAAASWASYEPDISASSRQPIKVNFSLTKPAHLTCRFKYQEYGQTLWNYITVFENNLFPRPAGSPAEVAAETVTSSFLWDGTDDAGNYITSGLDYHIDLKATGDIYGNIVISRGSRLSIPSLYVSPRSFFDPNDNEVQDISYVLSNGCRVTARIVDKQGVTVKTLLDNQFQDAGVQALAWNGQDEENGLAADGKYMVVIDAATDEGESARMVTESVVLKISDPAWDPTALQ